MMSIFIAGNLNPCFSVLLLLRDAAYDEKYTEIDNNIHSFFCGLSQTVDVISDKVRIHFDCDILFLLKQCQKRLLWLFQRIKNVEVPTLARSDYCSR